MLTQSWEQLADSHSSISAITNERTKAAETPRRKWLGKIWKSFAYITWRYCITHRNRTKKTESRLFILRIDLGIRLDRITKTRHVLSIIYGITSNHGETERPQLKMLFVLYAVTWIRGDTGWRKLKVFRLFFVMALNHGHLQKDDCLKSCMYFT